MALLAQVAVGHRQQLRAQLVDHPEQRALGRVAGGDDVADTADELVVLQDHLVGVEDLELGLRHQRRHPIFDRVEFGERAHERLFQPLVLAAQVARAQVAVDSTQESADHVRHAVAETGRRRQSDQARATHLDRRLDAGLTADLLVALELAVGLDHPPAVLVAFLFLGRKRLAQAKVRQDLRHLIGRGLEQAHFARAEFAAAQGLHDHHADRLLPPVLHRHAQKGVVALLAGFRKIFVARMADRVGHGYRLAVLDHQAD